MQASGTQDGSSGNLSYTYTRASQLKPAVYSQNSGAVITGLGGANFTKLQLNPFKSLSATKIAFSADQQLFVMNPDGTNPIAIGPTNIGAVTDASPSWYANGTVIAFVHPDQFGTGQIWRVNADGTGLQKLTSFLNGAYGPAWSPSGAKIAFYGYDAGNIPSIQTMNPDGSGQFQVTTAGEYDLYPSWSPDSTKIYFSHLNNSALYDLASVSAGGGTTSVIYASFFGGTARQVAIAPNGEAAYSSGSFIAHANAVNATYYGASAPPQGSTDSSPTFSPDGQWLMWSRFDGTTHTLWKKPAGSFSAADTQVTDGSLSYVTPAWGPFPGNRTLVGTGGILGATASGFLFGQSGDVTASVLAFSCTTPGTATIINQSPGGNVTNAVFQISGDAITSLKYIADVYSAATTIIPGSFTTATGALVSFNATTGRVVLVAPYSSAKRAVSAHGVVFDGNFLGVWRGGKQVSGATTHLEF